MKNLLSPSLYLFTILLVLSGCASKPNVHADSDPNQNFSEYRIFTWTNDNPMIVQSDYIVSPFVGQRVMDAIKSELEDKGYKYTQDLGEADFAIAFTIGARDKVKTRTEPTFVHTNWTWGGQYWGTAVVDVERTVTYTKGSSQGKANKTDSKRNEQPFCYSSFGLGTSFTVSCVKRLSKTFSPIVERFFNVTSCCQRIAIKHITSTGTFNDYGIKLFRIGVSKCGF
jgi:hypothetical protein